MRRPAASVDAPIPGMGGAGASRLGPPPAEEAGVTPTDIERPGTVYCAVWTAGPPVHPF